jgi:hypothetical protein
MKHDDWRLQGQDGYLTGVTLYRRAWTQSRPHWDHDHCEFCGTEFSTSSDGLHVGWTTDDEYRWMCGTGLTDFRQRFGWVIAGVSSPGD